MRAPSSSRPATSGTTRCSRSGADSTGRPPIGGRPPSPKERTMQRSKIKVGSDYAASNYRDWYQHAIKAVQVLDVGFWHHLSNWDKEADRTSTRLNSSQ